MQHQRPLDKLDCYGFGGLARPQKGVPCDPLAHPRWLDLRTMGLPSTRPKIVAEVRRGPSILI